MPSQEGNISGFLDGVFTRRSLTLGEHPSGRDKLSASALKRGLFYDVIKLAGAPLVKCKYPTISSRPGPLLLCAGVGPICVPARKSTDNNWPCWEELRNGLFHRIRFEFWIMGASCQAAR